MTRTKTSTAKATAAKTAKSAKTKAPAAKATKTAKPKKSSSDSAPTARAPGLAAAAPAVKSAPDSAPGSVVAKLAKQAKAAGEKVVAVLHKPTATTSISARYQLGGYEGQVLAPGQQILMELPAHLRGRPVRNVILAHRQNHKSTIGADKWDNDPGNTAAQVHSKDMPADKAWRYWAGPWGASGEEGGKYAEPRSAGDPEFETEFNFPKHGHRGAKHGDHSDALLYGDAVRAKSVGSASVYVHSVEVQVVPEKPHHFLEAVFCSGTSLGDAETLAGSKFGGGQSHGGKFPGALELSGWGTGGAGASKLPSGWKMAGGSLEIPLEAGKGVTAVDIACGDSHPDGVHNKDGGTGTPGWSRLSIGLKRASGSATEWFMDRQGVPPEGILSAGPTQIGYKAKAGDKIVIRAESDTTYVMAVRVGIK